jgi:transposase
MAGEFWLSDEAWAAIDPLLPKVYAGARRQHDRRIISGILHVLRSGCRWQDCPSVYGPSTTVYNRFNRWSGRGRWMAILGALRQTIPNDMRSIDSTSIKVQRAGAGGKGGHKRRRSAVRVAGGRPKSTRSLTAKGGYSAST